MAHGHSRTGVGSFQDHQDVYKRQTDSIPGVLGELDNLLEPGDALLVKASHFMGLERVVGGLVN